VIDEPAFDVTDHDAALVASIPAGDVLLIHDVLADSRTVKDLTVELRVLPEDRRETTSSGCSSSRSG
jgi:hypothetical protein